MRYTWAPDLCRRSPDLRLSQAPVAWPYKRREPSSREFVESDTAATPRTPRFVYQGPTPSSDPAHIRRLLSIAASLQCEVRSTSAACTRGSGRREALPAFLLRVRAGLAFPHRRSRGFPAAQ